MVDIKLTAGVFILLAIIGTTYYIGSGDTPYYCESTNTVGLCWKLSAVNSLGTQTRCYYNENTTTKYKNCKTGWTKYVGEVVGNPINESNEVSFDSYIPFDKLATLKKMGIGNIEIRKYINQTNQTNFTIIGYDAPKISPCIKKDNYTCVSKIYQKNEFGGINKEIELTYNYCNNWTVNENQTSNFTSECLGWNLLNQTEMENELINSVNKLINNIASVQESREIRLEEKLTRNIFLNIE